MPPIDSNSGQCGGCGAAIPKNAPFGQCPRCVLSLGRGMMLLAEPDEELLDAGQVRRFGEYELLEEIARGGMGVVYRARQLSLGREVAVKMILAGGLATTDSVARFRIEAAAAAALDHPNIVSVYEIGEHEMQHYFSMRLVLGRQNVATWAQALTLAPAECAQRIAEMMAKVARAVAFAHERGVLHRDLKPSNVLVDEKGEPQVTDFGLAKFISEEDSGLTLSAAMMGSPSHMAPEQADARHRDVTTLTDVYGLGAVLYELLAGRPPFIGKSALDTARLVVEQVPAPIPNVPRDLTTICLKCLAKQPAQRYGSAAALAEDLERFARGDSIRARPVTAPEAVWRWARRNPRIAALLTALLATFLLGSGGAFWQWRRAESGLAHLRWMEIARQAGTDEAPVALAHLARMLRENPRRWQAAMLAMSVVDQRAFPMLAGPPVLPGVKLVTTPRLAPDGSRFAAAAEDNSVRVWDSATGLERTRIALGSPATSVAVAQGPIAIAVATQDAQITIHAANDGGATPLSRSGSQPINDLEFSGDGTRLVARSNDRVEVWKCDALAAPVSFIIDGGIGGSAISADGARVFAWNAKRAAVWEVASGQALLEVVAREEFRQGSLAAKGKLVALLDGNFFARVWEVDSGAVRTTIDSPLPQLEFVALNADGTRVTLAGISNELLVYDTLSGLKISPPMRHLYRATALTASPDGQRTVSFGADGRASVWDAETGRAVRSAIWLNTELKASVDLSRDGETVMLYPESLRDGPATVSVWRGTKTQPVRRQRVEGQRDFATNRLSPDGRLGCIGLAPDFRAYLYELATGRVVLDARVHGDIYAHLFAPDMRRYYALTANGWLHGWSLETGEPLWPPGQQPGLIRPAAISPDGTRIIAGHNDGHIRIYDTATGALVQTLDHPGEIKVLRFAPDGSGRFLSSSTDKLAHVWQVQTGRKISTFNAHTETIIAAGWSPDSRLIATASYDQTARIWDAVTGREIAQPLPHLAWLSHLEFSPDGRLLATACRDGTVRFWHTRTGKPASRPLMQPSTAHTVRFTRDGACLLVRDHLGFSFWDAEKAEPVTVHFSEPITGGFGADCAALREILSTDGTQVHLGASMTEAALWTIAQARTAVPDWFPDFLESLALIRIDGSGTPRVSTGEGIFKVRERLARAGSNDPYAAWARRVLGSDSVK